LRGYSRLVLKLIIPGVLPELKVCSAVLPYYFFPIT